MVNCLLVGVGGQGTVLASRIISETAMNKGLKVCAAETIGMAQRGGSVVSHVKYGGNPISPLIAENMADVIIAFEPAEAVRSLKYLKNGGVVVVSDSPIQPTTASLYGKEYSVDEMLAYLRENTGRLIVVEADKILEECGSSKVLNVALLGAAARSGALWITREEIGETIKRRLPERFIEMNLKALYMAEI